MIQNNTLGNNIINKYKYIHYKILMFNIYFKNIQ